MNRSFTANGPLAPAAVLLSVLMLIVALAGPGLFPASADQFTPLEDPPSIMIAGTAITIGDPAAEDGSGGSIYANAFNPEDAEWENFEAFQPADERSTEIYNVFANITTNGQLKNVQRIRLCLYDSGDDLGDTDAEADALCGIPLAQLSAEALPALPSATGTKNAPESRLVMEWRSAAFHNALEGLDEGDAVSVPQVIIVGDNLYQDAGTAFNVDPDGTATGTAAVRFSFKVSEAMQVSEDWKIRVAAQSRAVIDEEPQTTQSDIDAPDDTYTVNYFAMMKADRAADGAINYGVVTPGMTFLKTKAGETDDSITSGQYHANDLSALTIEATDFVNAETNVIPLATNGDIDDTNFPRWTASGGTPSLALAIKNVPSGEASLDCAFSDEVVLTDEEDAALFVQVRNFARVLATSQPATGEGGTTSLGNHSCMLNYPGGGPVANVVYSNTVTLAMIQGSGTLRAPESDSADD